MKKEYYKIFEHLEDTQISSQYSECNSSHHKSQSTRKETKQNLKAKGHELEEVIMNASKEFYHVKQQLFDL